MSTAEPLALALAGLAVAGTPELPGPPPGNGRDLPAAPGTAPAAVPPGAAGAIPAGATGPGLVSGGWVTSHRRRFAFRFVCQASGRVRVAVARTPGAKVPYRCRNGRATVHVRLSRKLARRRTLPATAVVRQSGITKRLELRVSRRPQHPPPYWTDGHLQCSPDGSGAPPAYLVEPDFTTVAPTPISTRGWIAWYTPAGGWHWLGGGGEDKAPWNAWTAAPTGIAQFHPGGARQPVPFTWGPIGVPAGAGVYAIGVYEIVYWASGRPAHRWGYVNAGATGAVAAGTPTPYCLYP